MENIKELNEKDYTIPYTVRVKEVYELMQSFYDDREKLLKIREKDIISDEEKQYVKSINEKDDFVKNGLNMIGDEKIAADYLDSTLSYPAAIYVTVDYLQYYTFKEVISAIKDTQKYIAYLADSELNEIRNHENFVIFKDYNSLVYFYIIQLEKIEEELIQEYEEMKDNM